ncbi:heat shock factor protein isoform X3 [Frankliniella occidentalis]|uniref:Heat shock factor protein isoform X3 n=1 Tax=Frankliniella occidentalis TaxID=133901 RepID=A0A6J1RYQ0_FRAOC|nr:heat shock factor protein isoform X3 [Frankliniella occidentalis]
MHSLSEFGANVPAFLAKLWKLVDDPETNELISWTEEGTSFYIRDQAQFARRLLPMYYKHNNMASFIRQLNMYGFHKIVSADAGSLRLDKDEMEFAHQCFLRGHPYLLEHIKRKVGKSQILTGKLDDGKDTTNGGVVVKAEYMNKILSEVKSMRGRQDSVENRLTAMKQENEALWRELSLLRQKHLKQQTIVNKLIQFLVTLVQPSQRLNKRRYPLMINNVAHPSGKSNNKDPNDLQRELVVSLRDSLHASQIMSRSSSGPTIHELDDSILPDAESILPEIDSDSSNTITLHVPGSELAEVIDAGLEPEILSPDSEVLDRLQEQTTSLHVPLLEVNSIGEEMSEKGLKTTSPSPELLLAVPPTELNPSIVVPGLHTGKGKPTIQVAVQTAPQKTLSRSAPTRSVSTRRSVANSSKVLSGGSKAGSYQDMKNTVDDSQPAIKKEPRVIPPRGRKRKQGNKNSALASRNDTPKIQNEPVDILADLGLVTDSTNTIMSGSPNIITDGSNGSICGSVASPVNQLVAFPESPIPVAHSPVSSSPSHCSMMQSVSMSPLSAGPTITDVTSPLIAQFPSNTAAEQVSPQPSPVRNLSSPYDMTLACTSQEGTSPTPSFKSSFNRDDLDHHVGAMDADLGTLKDFLNSSGIQLDANTLLGLFNPDESMMPEGDGSSFTSKMDASGNELMYYQPDFMDLEEIWNGDNGRSTPPSSPILPEVNTPIVLPTSPGFPSPASKRRRN